jgi:hypothetical protein
MLNVIIGIMLSITASLGQVVTTGPVKSNFCQEILKLENIQPNLVLKNSVHLMGTVLWSVNQPEEFVEPIKYSRVELRKYISQRKQVTLKVVVTDANGHFDLGTVEPGKYRLLPSPTRASKQPAKLECPPGESTCDLKIGVRLNATDQPDAACPIQ